MALYASMKLDSLNSTLVLAGAWNPEILSPAWIAENILGLAPEAEDVVQIEFSPFVGAPPKYTMDEIVYVTSRDRLILAPVKFSVEAFKKARDIAGKILKMLPHTPIRAVGENFVFTEPTPEPEALELFTAASSDLADVLNFEHEIAGSSLRSIISFEKRKLNLTRKYDQRGLTISFNFHYDVDGAVAAAEVLPNSVERNLEVVDSVLQGLYGLTVDATLGDME